MHFAKNTKFWKYIVKKIGSDGIELKSQSLKNRKINSRRNPHYIW